MRTVGKILRNLLIIFLVVILIVAGISYFLVFQGTKNYPIKYGDVITQQAEKFGLEPTLVAALVDTESAFDPNAESHLGTRGLMQLLPKTAKWVASQLSIDYDDEKLWDPAYNVELGTYYLSYLVGHFQNVEFAIAAYNAGLNAVDDWIADGLISRDTDSLSEIPFEETRDYVKNILHKKSIYDVFYKEGLPNDTTQTDTFALAFTNWRKALGIVTGKR
uniref:lytic transglycosylase domain-containing protein n=1 Tax=Ndongobacter massiliensis TaxID=1871025 RepID=UPI00093084D3|nr:lytic transglycosylase domain-containing protein [Ndongobacter massiliensis]